MAVYLDRLNISVEEYQFLVQQNQATEKDQAKNEVSRLLNEITQSGSTEAAVEKMNQFLNIYQDTGDFEYYYLFAELYLTVNVKHHQPDFSDPTILKIRDKLQLRLNQVETWGRFELAIFVNSLYLFDTEFIEIHYADSFRKTLFYTNNVFYRQDHISLLLNGLMIFIDRDEWTDFEHLFADLKAYYRSIADPIVLVYLRIFELISKSHQGQPTDQLKYELYEKLSWLKMNSWINYLEANL